VSDLSALSRIVTINDIRLIPMKADKSKKSAKKSDVRVVMEATIKTYRYINENADDTEGDV